MSTCPDCRYPIRSWQEFCPNCGGEAKRTSDPVWTDEDGSYAYENNVR